MQMQSSSSSSLFAALLHLHLHLHVPLSRTLSSSSPRTHSLSRRRLTVIAAPRAAASPDSPLPAAPSASSPLEESYDLTLQNVDRVLDEVRPYLISDGGNVHVVSLEDGVICLELQGACGSCPSSSTTMKMGIERVLKDKFGDAVKDIRQVNDHQLPSHTTVQAVNNHLDILRPAIKNYGGSVEVLSVHAQDCFVKYVGPESIGSGIKAAIKERFQDILNVVFTDE